jgi:hypothetical protein
VDKAAEHGVTAIIQPGGSIKDEEVIRPPMARDSNGLYRDKALQALITDPKKAKGNNR